MFEIDNQELTYWPISGLPEGGNSETITFTVPTPTGPGRLSCTDDPRVKVMVRRAGVGVFVDLTETEIDLYYIRTMEGLTEVEFDIYVEALSPISGLERIPIAVIAGSATPAGWTS